MNPALLNTYPVNYSLSNDLKYPSRDRAYEYMDRNDGLGGGILGQSIGLGTSNNVDYSKFSSNQLTQDGSCRSTNSQNILTPPQSGDESSSLPHPSSSSFAYSSLPKVSGGNASTLDYYQPNPGNFLPPTFNGANMTQADRRSGGALQMPPLSPPYGFGHSFPPYSMGRTMPDYHHLPTQRNSGSYDVFHRPSRAPTLSLNPFGSVVPPYTQSMTQQASPRAPEGPPFDSLHKIHSLVNSHHQSLDFDIIASIPKGFFQVDGKWTCYRRNYFNVSCGFSFKSQGALDGPVYLQRFNHPERVHAYAVSIAAVTAAANSADSEGRGLVQHTPKRDKATESTPSRHIVVPSSLPYFTTSGSITGIGVGPSGSHHHGPASTLSQGALFPSPHLGGCMTGTGGLEPYVQSPNTAVQQSQTQHLFERIQFQKATANNGKRRAQQQYFHVVVKLEVNVGRSNGQEEWVVIGTKQSQQMVVRGRSPGHYKDNRRDSRSSMDPDCGGPSNHHHHEGTAGGAGGHSGYSLNSIGASHSSALGHPSSSYRHSHHYGSSYTLSTQQQPHSHKVPMDGSESSSASPCSSGTLGSMSPIKSDGTGVRQLDYSEGQMALSNFSFGGRTILSPILGKHDIMDYHSHHRQNHIKTLSNEEEVDEGTPDHFFHHHSTALGVDAGTYNGTPSFDFSATATHQQALCASS